MAHSDYRRCRHCRVRNVRGHLTRREAFEIRLRWPGLTDPDQASRTHFPRLPPADLIGRRRQTCRAPGGRVHRWAPCRARTNADDRLPADPLSRIESGDGIVEGRDVAASCWICARRRQRPASSAWKRLRRTSDFRDPFCLEGRVRSPSTPLLVCTSAPRISTAGVAKKSHPLLLEGDPPATAGEADLTFDRRQLRQALVRLGYFE